MKNKFINLLRGTIVAILLSISLIVFAVWILLIGAITWLIPLKIWRHYGNRYLQQLPIHWALVNRAIITLCTYNKFQVNGDAAFNPHGRYVLIANHSSWVDILILTTFFADKLPIMKFFMKKELLWSLPVAGLACYILGYPFMERHSADDIRKNPALKGKDIETAKKACEKFKEFPTIIMNFVEGTRFSQSKKIKQASPYHHLLKPKAMGVALVINELQNELDGIVNVTLAYSTPNLSFWRFACGEFENIYMQYELLPVTPELIGDCYEDRQFRKSFQAWLNELWQKKDLELISWNKAYNQTKASDA